VAVNRGSLAENVRDQRSPERSRAEGSDTIELRAMICVKRLELPSDRGSSSSRWLMGGTTMANLENIHDKLWWASFEDTNDAIAELRSVLPETLVSQLDWSSLRPLPERFVDEAMRGSQADRLYHARCGGSDALIYVLWEHKSEVDKWTLLQLLRYMVRIWEQRLGQKPAPATLPPIIPVIIHHSETGWTAATTFHGLFDPGLLADETLRRMTPAFEVSVDDISHLSDGELRARGMSPRAALGLLFLRDGRREGRILMGMALWAELLMALWNSPNGRRALEQLIGYALRVTPSLDPSELSKKVGRVIPEAEELVMTAAEQLIQQGRAEGISQGILQGLQQGKRGVLRRQLELKFGALSADAIAQLESADEPTLERYAERVITATVLSDVFGN
jgi:predicted transposase YdaD